MKTELVHTQRNFRRLVTYRVAGLPNEPARDGQPALKPETVSVDLDRYAEDAPWVAEFVTVSGRRVRKDGKLGSSWAKQLWSGSNNEDMPPWVNDLVSEAIKQADAERAVIRPSRLVVVNEHGRFEAGSEAVDRAIQVYLPASVKALASVYRGKTGVTVSDVHAVAELLVMLARVDTDQAARVFEEGGTGC